LFIRYYFLFDLTKIVGKDIADRSQVNLT